MDYFTEKKQEDLDILKQQNTIISKELSKTEALKDQLLIINANLRNQVNLAKSINAELNSYLIAVKKSFGASCSTIKSINKNLKDMQKLAAEIEDFYRASPLIPRGEYDRIINAEDLILLRMETIEEESLNITTIHSELVSEEVVKLPTKKVTFYLSPTRDWQFSNNITTRKSRSSNDCSKRSASNESLDARDCSVEVKYRNVRKRQKSSNTKKSSTSVSDDVPSLRTVKNNKNLIYLNDTNEEVYENETINKPSKAGTSKDTTKVKKLVNERALKDILNSDRCVNIPSKLKELVKDKHCTSSKHSFNYIEQHQESSRNRFYKASVENETITLKKEKKIKKLEFDEPGSSSNKVDKENVKKDPTKLVNANLYEDPPEANYQEDQLRKPRPTRGATKKIGSLKEKSLNTKLRQ